MKRKSIQSGSKGLLALALALVCIPSPWADPQPASASRLKKVLWLDKNSLGSGSYQNSRRDLGLTLQALSDSFGFQVDALAQTMTPDSLKAAFKPDNLAQYQVVLFGNNESVQNLLDSASRDHIQAYVEGGGALMPIHMASAFIQNWPWYSQSLVQSFYGPHGNDQPKADLKHDSEGLAPNTETRGIFKGLTEPKAFLDEFISFRESPRDTPGVTVLVTLDEKSFNKTINGPMGDDHPVVWVKEVGKGKVIHNSLGFSWSMQNVYTQSDGYLTKLLYGLMRYGAGDFKGCMDSAYREYNPEATLNDSAACLTSTHVGVRQVRSSSEGAARLLVKRFLSVLTIQVAIRGSESWMLELVDNQGRVHHFQSSLGSHSLEWPKPRQPGLYFLRLRSGGNQETHTLPLL
jgi:uncharacterized protein